MSMNQYIAPYFMADASTKLAFWKELVKEGETYIRTQTAYADFKDAKNIIAGIEENKMPAQLSKTKVNLQKRLIRDVVATMSNLRPLWNYSTDNRDLDEQAELLNKLLLNWYQTTFADRQIKKALQYAAVMGTGYLGPDWKSDYWTRGRGDIVLKAYSPEDVLPTQLPQDGDLQRAYSVTFREEVPINLARAMFPTLAHKIHPDRQAPSGMRRGMSKLGSFLSPVLNRFAADQKSRKTVDSIFPTVDIYQTYILDLTINETQNPIVMGEPGTYWSYIVPPLNSDIPDGLDVMGNPKFRKATVDDAALYPFRRLVTWCSSTELRDGPSFWWHGKVPAVKLCFDDWAWESLGYSMTRDLSPIESSSNNIRRAMDDAANAKLRPAMIYDDRTMAQSAVEAFDTRQPGKALGVDFTISELPIRPAVPSEYYRIDPEHFKILDMNDAAMKYLSGVVDMEAVTKAQQIPASDTVEKIFEMAGPIVTDISRNLEAALGQLGEMVKCMFFEFYTAPRRIQILGPDGFTKQDMEPFDPATLIPSHSPGEDVHYPSAYSKIERAKKYMNSFFFRITPNSLHQITQMTRKLLYIQLQKNGMPIDPWTMAEINDLPNFGRAPAGAMTMFDKWVAFERIKGELQAEIQAKTMQIMQSEQFQMQLQQQAAMAKIQMAAQQEQQQEGQDVVKHFGGGGGAPPQGGQGGPPPQGGGSAPPPPPGAPPAGGAPGQSGGGPASSHLGPGPALGHKLPGRPPEFGGTPIIEQKDGGTRSTITSHK